MPLVALAYLAAVAGLAAGLALPVHGAVAPLLQAAALALAALALVRRRLAEAGLLLTVAASIVIAREHRARESRCRAAVEQRRAWRGVLEDDLRPGARSRARVRDASGCTVAISVAASHGTARAGALVELSGTALPAEGAVALRVMDARVRPLGAGSARLRMHARVR
ncbi:MAG TPA: hypothetical protein VF048_00930, partial [Gemmatimonadaceae bacterium]